jgi:hypothetical protein
MSRHGDQCIVTLRSTSSRVNGYEDGLRVDGPWCFLICMKCVVYVTPFSCTPDISCFDFVVLFGCFIWLFYLVVLFGCFIHMQQLQAQNSQGQSEFNLFFLLCVIA